MQMNRTLGLGSAEKAGREKRAMPVAMSVEKRNRGVVFIMRELMMITSKGK